MNKRINERHQKCSTAAEKISLLKRLNKVGITTGLVFLVMVLTACSQQETPDNSSLENSAEISSKKTDVPDVVLETARQYVEQRYDDVQDENYNDWRIESLTYAYTYDDLDGMTLQVYQMNYEFLASDLDKVMLVGGMTIDEEGWVVTEYANSTYFVFKQDGETLTYLTFLHENDCDPGDELFTNDLRQRLSTDNIGEMTKESTELLTLGELAEMQDVEEIGNQIPQWVMGADWDTPMYVMSSTDTEKFDSYAKENFPNFCDWGWTQEQSDEVYLGQGIEIINLDGGMRESGAVYYPVILNGVIVSVYEVYENIDSQEIHFQAAPYFVNELNALMSVTSTDIPLILGYNNDNLIGIIGDIFYILDIDHMDHKQVDADRIPAIEIESHTVVNAMESLCAERAANVDDWHVLENIEY